MSIIQNSFYSLPNLPYHYNSLEPYISEEQLILHYKKHHQNYITNANLNLENLQKLRENQQKYNFNLNYKSIVHELIFNISGHMLHSLFWKNLCPINNQNSIEPIGILAKKINKDFGNFNQFKKEFNQLALSTEGSGWVALTFCIKTNRLLLMQIEKHSVNIFPMFKILMLLDVWEHAYYLDYKNNRQQYIDIYWNIVNWEQINKNFENINSIVDNFLFL